MYKIGFIGAGKMAGALVAALLRGKLASPDAIICSDPSEEQRRIISDRFGVGATADNATVLAQSDIVLLAFKPQNFPDAVAHLTEKVRPDHIIISIMAGVPIAAIRRVLPGRVVRVMPNTACMVAQMAAGFAAADNVTTEDLARVRQILQCAGLALEVTEEQLDAVTGLSGSGPAFVAYLLESFIAAGTAAGLSEETAQSLTFKTFSGTVQLLDEWNITPAELIQMVSSPQGTTVAGREILESSDVRQIIERTIIRAAQRSKELGK